MISPGFYGKLPDRGDFVERRLPPNFVAGWDRWLQECLSVSRVNLGDQWLDTYLTSPIWYFALGSGVVDESAYIGVMMPSVDKVGRYFPLAAVAPLTTGVTAVGLLEQARPWFRAVEPVLLAVLDDEPLVLDQFDRTLADIALDETHFDALIPEHADTQIPWRFGFEHTDDIRKGFAQLAGANARDCFGACSAWLTQGSDSVEPSLIVASGLPGVEQFTSLMTGQWSERHWRNHSWTRHHRHFSSSVPAPRSASLCDVGKVREINEDACAALDTEQLWIVADGLGGHDAGNIASSMAVGVAAHIPTDASIESRIDSFRSAMSVVQANLHQMSDGLENMGRPATTVVALITDADSYACAWAGDSRAYRLRDDQLVQLTRDHAEPSNNPSKSAVVTRAVGGDDPLQLDCLFGDLHAGDRFVLCSDGVHQLLPHHTLTELVSNRSPEEACAALHYALQQTEAPDNYTAVVVDFPDLTSTHVPRVMF